MTTPMKKDYLLCNSPTKIKLHIVQLHVIQKYMDVHILLFVGKYKPKQLYSTVFNDQNNLQ